MGEGVRPFAQDILMNAQVTCGLCRRHSAVPDQLDRLDLELPTESSSPHDPTSGFMKHLNSVSIKPAAAQKVWPVDNKVGDVRNTGAELMLPIEVGDG
jgi:hypothetical protein